MTALRISLFVCALLGAPPLMAETGREQASPAPSQAPAQPPSSDKFAASNFHAQFETLRDMKDEQRGELLKSLRADYAKAETPEAKGKARDAVARLSLFELRRMGVTKDAPPEAAVAGVLRYMDRAMVPDGRAYDPKKRDAIGLGPLDVLADGRTNGCVESVRTYQTLLKLARPDIQTKYLSSFDLDWARQARKSGNWSQASGHAMLQVGDPAKGGTFLLDPTAYPVNMPRDAAQFSRPLIINGKPTEHVGALVQAGASDFHVQSTGQGYTITRYERGRFGRPEARKGAPQSFPDLPSLQAELERLRTSQRDFAGLQAEGVVKPEDADGSYLMGLRRFVIFERKDSCPYKKQLGPEGSNASTIKAAQGYLRRRP